MIDSCETGYTARHQQTAMACIQFNNYIFRDAIIMRVLSFTDNCKINIVNKNSNRKEITNLPKCQRELGPRTL